MLMKLNSNRADAYEIPKKISENSEKLSLVHSEIKN